MSTLILAIKRRFEHNDALLKHGLIMLAASAGGSVLNYLYQLFMGRMLGPEQYGIFGALISLAYVLTVPVQTIQIITTKSVSRLLATSRGNDLGFLIRHLGKKVALGSLLGMVTVVAASGVIADFFRIPSVIPIIVLGIAFFFQLLVPVVTGALLGLQRFVRLGANQIVNFGSKFVFGVALVALGLGVQGALAGMILGGALSLFLGAYFLRDVLGKAPAGHELPEASSYSFYTFLTFLLVTLFYNVDVMLVKRFFDSAQAGYYTAAATLAKAVFFGSVALAGAMFPKVSTWSETGNGEETIQLLKDALIYTGLLAGLGTLLFNLFPGFAVSLLYGSAYTESIGLVGLFSIGMLFFSLSYVLVLYQLALGRKAFVLLLALGALVEVAGIALFHATLWHVVMVFTATMAVLFLGMMTLAVAQVGLRQRGLPCES